MHVFKICEDTGKWSTDENIVIADSMEEAKALFLAEYPTAKIDDEYCVDWGEVKRGWIGSISTGDN